MENVLKYTHEIRWAFESAKVMMLTIYSQILPTYICKFAALRVHLRRKLKISDYKKSHIMLYLHAMDKNTTWIQSLHACMYQRIKDFTDSPQWVLNKYSRSLNNVDEML